MTNLGLRFYFTRSPDWTSLPDSVFGWGSRACVTLLAVAVLLTNSSALAQTETNKVAISDSGARLTRNGVSWMALSDLPNSIPGIPAGLELGRKEFKIVAPSPDNSNAAVVVRDSNHDWVAVVQASNRNVLLGYLLYGGSASGMQWSPDGTRLLVESRSASGLPSLVLISLSQKRPPVNLNALAATSLGHSVGLGDPVWHIDGDNLECIASDPNGGSRSRIRIQTNPQFPVNVVELKAEQ